MSVTQPTLWTIGHGTRPWEDFLDLLRQADIAVLADVRRFAGSRHNPQFSRDALPAELRAAGIDYLPLPGLGGRRKALPDSPNTAWRVEAFRAYADHMGSAEYTDARTALMATASARRTCVMCAETLWWRCHRRLIADDFSARGWRVLHLLARGKTQSHLLNADAVLVNGVLRYPARTPGMP
ncbi:MAG: DUF488 domain-containing protein [Proteobacteria bacterium]|nr:DUF488 domain-containing protein [Pseudomonadota bacterium]